MLVPLHYVALTGFLLYTLIMCSLHKMHEMNA